MAQDVAGNGSAVPQPAAAEPAQTQQQLIINAQYIKDLSFENPHAPNSLRQQTAQPSVDINVDVKAQGMGPENYEVVLTIKGGAKVQDETLFLVELAYGAIITVRNVPQELLSMAVLVETPRLLFPFAREIIATAVRNGGFAPLLLDPIDFVGLYRQRLAAAQPSPPSQPINPN